MNRVFGWKKRLGVLAVAALTTGVLGLTAGSPAAQTVEPCTITGPTTGPSPVVTGGTRIVFKVECQGHAARTIGTAVEVDNVLVVRDKETISGKGQAVLEVVKDIFVKPTKVCVEVDEERECVVVPPAA